MSAPSHDCGDNAIAIVGMAGRFPGAPNVDQFWQNLRNGVESIRPLTDEELLAAGADPAWLRDPNYIKAAGVLDGVALFDAGFFGFSPKDAGILDPQHRHFMECAVTALEHAGHAPKKFRGSIGVFAGCGMNAYFINNLLSNPDLVRSVGVFLLRHTGNDRDFLASTVSYKLDLRGPSVAIQTACSTSLVAVHAACQSLLSGECDMALAGGVTILVPHGQGYFYRENEPVSPDGHCRPFEARSAGTVVSSGAGIVVLRRLDDALEDGDTVHAVIRGGAINNDGAGKVGYLAPSVAGHASVVSEALAVAGATADTIQYVEAHGTGTPVGDPIEIAALTRGFRETTEKSQFCRIGSVKSNIGHLDTAAGVASLIKVTQALAHGEMPPTLHFESPNPEIDFESTPFIVNAELRPWVRGESPRRAGISSLGIGGTNAHVVIEEAPELPATDAPGQTWQLLPLSAKSASALDAATDNLAAHLREHPEISIADAAFTLQEGREAWDHRRVVAVRDHTDAVAALEQRDAQRVFSARREGGDARIVFLFPGAGAQFPNMARDLYEQQPVFRTEMDRCLAWLRTNVDIDLAGSLYPAPGAEAAARADLERPSRALTAIFATEIALARLWSSWGVEPAAMIGHSLGEYAAAHLAGVMSLEDSLRLVALRGTLADRISGGAMLSIPLPEAEVRELVGDHLDLAAVNAPLLCVASGRIEQLTEVREQLAAREIECRLIPVAGAGHSRLLDPILDEFARGAAAIRFSPPRIPYVSNVTGTWIQPEECCNPNYWVRHFRGMVRFSDGLGTLLADDDRVLLEVGPGGALGSMARQQPRKPRAVVPSLRKPDDPITDLGFATASFGRLWAAGAAVSFAKLRGDERRRRIPLPTYPFEHRSFWIEPGRPAVAAQAEQPLERLAAFDDWFSRPVWRRAPLPPATPGTDPERWLVFADATGLASAVVDRLRAAGHDVTTVRPGDTFYCFGDHEYALAPEAGRVGYDELVSALAARDRLPHRIAHFWTVTADESFRPGSSFLHRNQECGFYSLLFLAQALSGQGGAMPRHIAAVSNGMQSVAGERVTYPEKATVLGPIRVIPHEWNGVACQSIDVELPPHRPARFFGRKQSAGSPEIALAESITAELLAAPASATVAYRKGERFEQTQERVAPAAAQTSTRIRDGGVYVVTGGLGGIGFALAEKLALQHRAKLVLVSRSALPHESEWESWLHAHGARDATSRRIRAVRELRAAGAELLVAAADVADVERMSEVLSEAKERFGVLHGVLHAAGSLEDGVIQTKTPEQIERVFTPKLHGTLVLAHVLEKEPLDFVALFSSTSALLGPPGQVDYVAANCFLDAFAQHREKPFTVAINWGVWNEVGGAAAISRRLHGEREVAASRLTGHPMLGECVAEGPKSWLYAASYRPAEQWVLDEHRSKARVAIVPGTAYLELARAAFRDATGESAAEIRDVAFLAPLAVGDDEARSVEVELTRDADGFEFEVRSGEAGELHARGHVASLRHAAPARIDAAALAARCERDLLRADGPALQSAQESELSFGPRWASLRRIGFGPGEAFAELSLPTAYTDDLTLHALHPALLDVATGCALRLIEGYETGRALYVPMGYSRVRAFGPLPARLASHVRSRPDNDFARETATFDVTLCDESGDVVVEVEGLTLRKLAQPAAFAAPRAAAIRSHGRSGESSPAERVFLETFEAGLRVDEGVRALERALAGERSGPLVVSPVDLTKWRERLARACVAELETPSVKFERPELESDYEAPRDDVEKALVGFWEELLGVDRIGIRDDFFEVGGHSLIAVRLFAKIKKQWGIELPISVLFDSPTIEGCAALLREEIGTPADGAPSAGTSRRPKYRYLVPMNDVGSTRKTPFFLVAGMFGNVLNLRHLAAHLGSDQPVYAIQAKGLYGEDVPHRRFEEMAEDYLRELREVQPEGPYLLGGFSGGGITAFEMAQQLTAQGEEVAALILLDSIPSTWPEPTRRDRLVIQAQRVQKEGPAYFARWIRNRIRWELEKREARRNPPTLELTPAEFRSNEIEAAFREALAHYDMKVYPGKILLFRPPLDACHDLGNGRFANSKRERIDHLNFWQPWARGGVEVQVVVGDHDSMVLEPSVRILGARVRAALEGAQRDKPEDAPSR